MFSSPLMYFWNIGHLGLALATSVAAYINAGLLLRGLVREKVYRKQPQVVRYVLRLVLATFAMWAVIAAMVSEPAQWLAWRWDQRAMQMALVCIAGGATYVVVHLLLGTRLRHLRAPSAV